MFNLSSKTALVTGGSRGIGYAIARKLAESGATVFIDYCHSPEDAQAAQAELVALGGTVHLIRAAVTDYSEMNRMFTELTGLTSALDILVNNAVSGVAAPVDGQADEGSAQALDRHLKASAWCSELAAPLMSAGGAIVTVSPAGSSSPQKDRLTTGALRAGLEALTRQLAVEFAPAGVRVNMASCGPAWPAATAPSAAADGPDREGGQSPPPAHDAVTEDFANLVLVLASDAAAGVTGQTVVADGGVSLGTVLARPEAPRPVEGTGLTADPVRAATESQEIDVPPVTLPARNGTGTAKQELLSSSEQRESEEDLIAVVGMGLTCPGANSPEEFWQLRMSGEVMFSEPGDRWDLAHFYSPDPHADDRSYTRRAGHIHNFEPVSKLAAEMNGRPGGSADFEYTTMWLRNALLQALETVGHGGADRFSCFVGYTPDGSQHLEEAIAAAGLTRRLVDRLSGSGNTEVADKVRAAVARGLPRAGDRPWSYLGHVVGRSAAAGILPADTGVTMVDTACSSSLYSVDLGAKELLAGTCDIAVCGGAYALAPRSPVLFSKLQGLSKSDSVRAFDRAGDGVLFGDGAGAVVLKTLRRARADGDPVLGIIAGVGTSSDGKGKAIYAPNSDGQQLAVHRAQRSAGIGGEDVDWVAAHATGTPAGDLAEFQTLQATVGLGNTCFVTSNKSQIGHTGWVAGLASLIEVLLAFSHQTIPPQQQFDEPAPGLGEEGTSLVIPKTPQAWPSRPEHPRTAAVSGFGFGGTNAHLVVHDRAAATSASGRRPAGERIGVVAWTAQLPGSPDDATVARWLLGEEAAPAPSFGPTYPLPSFRELRIPPQTLRNIDRCQIMMLDCVSRLRPQLEDYWSKVRETTGVLVGHTGATRHATLYTMRCYLDHFDQLLGSDSELWEDPVLRQAYAEFREEVLALTPAAVEDSLPGMMPNVIPARVSNYFNFRGVNMTVDTGASAALGAIQVASKYLDSGDLDLALVAGINGNDTPELYQLLGESIGRSEIAEGVFMLALTRESQAREHGLPILGFLDACQEPFTETAGDLKEVSVDPAAGGRTYLGGDMAKAVIQGLVGSASTARLSCRDPHTGQLGQLVLDKATEDSAPAASLAARRHVVRLRSLPSLPPGEGSSLAQASTVVLTDEPETRQELSRRGFPVVLTTGVPAGDLEQQLADLPASIAGIVVISRIACHGDSDCAPERALGLHDATFLALRSLRGRVAAGRCVVALLDAVEDGVPRPHTGMFTGFTKSIPWELPQWRAQTIAMSTDDLGAALDVIAAESSSAKACPPFVVYDGDVRRAPAAEEEPLPSAAELPLDGNSVVVATGGARGITAEVLIALTEKTHASVWVLGATRLDDYRTDVFEDTEAAFSGQRADYLREYRRKHPEEPLAHANREFERMLNVRQARANLASLAANSGADKVHYLACDVTDSEAVRAAAHTILSTAGKIDLFINGAGINKSAALANKTLEDFQRVRDVKVRGYHLLKSALADNPPRMWCNFGSAVGFAGRSGELDYASGNDFLATAAEYAQLGGAQEFTIAWTLWKTAGFAADPLMQAYLHRSGEFSGMEREEGVRHFIDELASSRRDPAVVHLEPAQRAEIEHVAPGLFGSRQGSPAGEHGFLLGRRIQQGQGRMVFERFFDVDREKYLQDHLVNGVPTLPGAFLVEIAAEAASSVLPGHTVTALSSLAFRSLVRVKAEGSTYRIAAETVPADSADSGEALVKVQVMSDVYAPNGMLLRQDRSHFEATVHLRQQAADPPRARELPEGPASTSLPDPYLFSNDVLYLSGVFVTNQDSYRWEGGWGARFRLQSSLVPPGFENFRIPAMLLDGLFRVGVLNSFSGDWAPLVAPTRIDRIDVHATGGYVQPLAFAPEGIGLRCHQGGSGIDPAEDRLVAISAEGKALLEVRGLVGATLAYVNTGTGEVRTAVPERVTT